MEEMSRKWPSRRPLRRRAHLFNFLRGGALGVLAFSDMVQELIAKRRSPTVQAQESGTLEHIYPPSTEKQQWLADNNPRLFDFVQSVPMDITPKHYEIRLAQLRILVDAQHFASTVRTPQDYKERAEAEMIARAVLLSRVRRDD